MTGHFKIVAILKKRGSSTILEYSYVPYQWEKDGILYWPKRNILSLRKDSTSMYESDWEEYKCKVKRDNIVGIDEAELWEEEYVNASCTESEETLSIKRQDKPSIERIQQPIPSRTSIDKLFEDLNPTSIVPETHFQEQPEKLTINKNNTIHDTNNFLLPAEYDSANVTTIDVSSLNLPVIHSQNDLVLKEILQIILDIQACQTRMEEHQKLFAEKMNAAVLKLSLTTDKVYTMLKGIQESSLAGSSMHINPSSSITDPLNLFPQKFIFPLNTVSDVLSFNKEISTNKEYRIYLIDTYKTVGGIEGNEEGKNVAKNIVAIFFSKYVLTLFSWTGVSRTAGIEKKECFQLCDGILSLINDLTAMADSRWNVSKNEKLFKNHVLKHAKQINAAIEKKKERNINNNEQSIDTISNNEPDVDNNGNKETEKMEKDK